MKLFRNKLFVGLLCIVAGIAIVFYAIPEVTTEQSKKVKVLEATENIEAGTMLNDEIIRYIEIPYDIAPDNTATFKNSIGKYAISTIYAGDIVTKAKIVSEYIPDDTYALATEKGKLIVSISVKSISSIAAARIRSGDVVTVMALPNTRNYSSSSVADTTGIEVSNGIEPIEDDTEEQNTDDTENVESNSTEPTPIPSETIDPTEIEPAVLIYPELQYMEIAAIVAKEGENASVNTEIVDDEENSLPVTISFYATEEQAMRLAELEKNGTAYIAFVARGANAFAFIPESEKVLK